MNTSTTAMSSSTGTYNTPAFWERLWRMSGIGSLVLLVIAYGIYGNAPSVGSSADAVAAFYDGHRARILIAAVLSGMGVLNLLWFAAALRTDLADARQDGWGAAVTASSAALGVSLLLLAALGAALAYSITRSADHSLTAALNDFGWSVFVLSSFPRAMFVMSGTFGLWRAGLISNALFGAGVAVVVLVLLGGTTWLGDGLWSPDGLYSRYVSPIASIAWLVVVSRILLTRNSIARAGW